eukprot:gene39888-53932_t
MPVISAWRVKNKRNLGEGSPSNLCCRQDAGFSRRSRIEPSCATEATSRCAARLIAMAWKGSIMAVMAPSTANGLLELFDHPFFFLCRHRAFPASRAGGRRRSGNARCREAHRCRWPDPTGRAGAIALSLGTHLPHPDAVPRSERGAIVRALHRNRLVRRTQDDHHCR